MNEPAGGETLWGRGQRLERAGDVQGALAAYSQATDAGEEPEDPRSVLRYAEQLEARGRAEEAEIAFRRACGSGEADVAAAAWRGAAAYLIQRGEFEKGFAALEAIVAIGDPDESPRALRNIGTLREDVFGDVQGARAAYEAAISYGHPQHSPGARVNLAQLLEKQGDLEGATAMFRAAIDSGHPIEGVRARALLGLLIEARGDDDGALAEFETAIALDREGEWGQRAAFSAGGIHMRRDEFALAADAFRIAGQIAEPDNATMAAYLCGEAERELGNEQAALDAYLRAVEVDAAQSEPARLARFTAAKEAGVILAQRQEPDAARRLFALVAGPEAGAPAELRQQAEQALRELG